MKKTILMLITVFSVASCTVENEPKIANEQLLQSIISRLENGETTKGITNVFQDITDTSRACFSEFESEGNTYQVSTIVASDGIGVVTMCRNGADCIRFSVQPLQIDFWCSR